MPAGNLQPHDIVGYTYRADEYCPEHIVEDVYRHLGIEGHGLSHVPEQALDLLARMDFGIDREDEASFDSGNFPKVIFRDQCETVDDEDAGRYADRCGQCGRLLDR